MQSYTIVLRNAHGRVVSRFEFGCSDDEEARLVAQEEAHGRAAELWNGERRIGAWAVARERTAAARRIAELLAEPLPVPAGAAVIATSPLGLVLHWDRNAVALYGWSGREALGRGIVDLTPATQSRIEAAEVMRALQAGQTWAGEIVLRRKDGGLFRAFVLDVPVDGAPGRPGGIVGVSLPETRAREILQARTAIEDELARRFGRAPDGASPRL